MLSSGALRSDNEMLRVTMMLLARDNILTTQKQHFDNEEPVQGMVITLHGTYIMSTIAVMRNIPVRCECIKHMLPCLNVGLRLA